MEPCFRAKNSLNMVRPKGLLEHGSPALEPKLDKTRRHMVRPKGLLEQVLIDIVGVFMRKAVHLS